MNNLIQKMAIYYMSLEAFFRKHKKQLIKVFAIFFALIIAVLIWNRTKAVEKTSEEIVVVVDAGHGGSDPGKVSGSGKKEKDLNLAIAMKLKAELEQRGIKVIMTRTDDTDLATRGAVNKKRSDMINRTEMINGSSAVCFISIHQNSFTSPDVKGAQVFYYGKSEDGKKLAKNLQAGLIEYVDKGNNRIAKEGNDYYILRKTSIPGVIVECGFLSCPEEEAKLSDEEYQKKIANAIALVIDEIY